MNELLIWLVNFCDDGILCQEYYLS
uniref:Uncharacterized protein n=1 Tax=Arundo donax TaxID=35708 RepID=A0A0A9BC22_ARUDO